jgi:hypothetical protein
MRAMAVVSSLALVAGLAVSAAAQSGQPKAATGAPEKVVYDASAAMAFLTTTSGDWMPASGAQHEHSATPAAPRPGAAVTVKTKAAGSAVVHQYRQGTPGEMETIFHMDGDKLLLTHYCALQNAPVLQFVKSDKPGELKFVFKGGTNFDPKVDAHLHESTFQIIDKNTIEQRSTVFTNGKADPELKTVLQRRPTSE